MIGPSASAQPTYGGGGSAYVLPSRRVTPLQGLQSAAGAGTNVTYTQGLPTDSQLTAIPSTDLTPAYARHGFGGRLHRHADRAGDRHLRAGDHEPVRLLHAEYLSLNGTQLIDNPGTPPVSTYSVAVNLTAGQQYTLAISGGGEA